MPGGPVTVELLEALVAATAEAREATREAHAARKDLRLAIREAEERTKTLRADIAAACGELAKEKMDALFEAAAVPAMAAGLKKSLQDWIDMLAEARSMLDRLNAQVGLAPLAPLPLAEARSALYEHAAKGLGLPLAPPPQVEASVEDQLENDGS